MLYHNIIVSGALAVVISTHGGRGSCPSRVVRKSAPVTSAGDFCLLCLRSTAGLLRTAQCTLCRTRKAVYLARSIVEPTTVCPAIIADSARAGRPARCRVPGLSFEEGCHLASHQDFFLLLFFFFFLLLSRRRQTDLQPSLFWLVLQTEARTRTTVVRREGPLVRVVQVPLPRIFGTKFVRAPVFCLFCVF